MDPQYCTDFGCDYAVEVVTTGNPELDAEQAQHWSVGVEVEPASWLVASLDAWSVEVDEAFCLLDAQTVVFTEAGGAEFYGETPDGLSVSRYPNGMIRQVVTGWANYGGVETRGVDVRVATEFDFGDAGALRNRLDVTKVADYEISRPWGGTAQEDTFGHPSLRASLQNVWNVGDFELGWTVQHIGDHGAVGAWTTHDLSASWQAPWNATLAVGATNVGDEMPELAEFDGRPWNFFLYDGYGRTAWARYTQRF
jgi:iron complex outermembrane receptor protein